MNVGKCVQVGFVSPLENAIGETDGVLVTSFCEVTRHFLIGWVAHVKVDVQSGLNLGSCEIGCIRRRSKGVSADFFDYSN